MIRRDFIKQAAIASGAALIPRVAFAMPVPDRAAPNRITAVVYDERYGDCRIFGRALQEKGVVAFTTAGETAQLWYASLRKHSARYGGCVAGLTTDADRGISMVCGRELKLRLVYEGIHDSRGSETVRHDFRSASGKSTVVTFQQNHEWANALAEYLAQSVDSIQSHSEPRSMLVANASSPRSANYPGYLTSWVLAP